MKFIIVTDNNDNEALVPIKKITYIKKYRGIHHEEEDCTCIVLGKNTLLVKESISDLAQMIEKCKKGKHRSTNDDIPTNYEIIPGYEHYGPFKKAHVPVIVKDGGQNTPLGHAWHQINESMKSVANELGIVPMPLFNNQLKLTPGIHVDDMTPREAMEMMKRMGYFLIDDNEGTITLLTSLETTLSEEKIIKKTFKDFRENKEFGPIALDSVRYPENFSMRSLVTYGMAASANIRGHKSHLDFCKRVTDYMDSINFKNEQVRSIFEIK